MRCGWWDVGGGISDVGCNNENIPVCALCNLDI